MTQRELSEKIKIKTKNTIFFSILQETGSEGGETGFRERKCDFSINFPAVGPSVLIGLRSKVDLRYKGYAWTPILWSFDNSKR